MIVFNTKHHRRRHDQGRFDKSMDDFHNAPETELINIGFSPSDPKLVFSQIQKQSIQSRTMGFRGLITILTEGTDEEIDYMIQNGIYDMILQSLNPSNNKIMGTIAVAISSLYSKLKENVAELAAHLPLDYLLTVNSFEVVDLLKECVDNTEDFAGALLSHEHLFANALANWLQSNTDTIKSCLDLLFSLALFDPHCCDFSIVRPFTDTTYNADIRAMAHNILFMTEGDQSDLNAVLSIVFEDAECTTATEILHDILMNQETPFFEESIPQLIVRLTEILSLPSAALLLAELTRYADDKVGMEILHALYSLPSLSPEHTYLIAQLIDSGLVQMNAEFLEKLMTEFAKTENPEMITAIGELLKSTPGFIGSEFAQAKLIESLERPQPFSSATVRYIVENVPHELVSDAVVEIINELATTLPEELQEIAEPVHNFLSSRQN